MVHALVRWVTASVTDAFPRPTRPSALRQAQPNAAAVRVAALSGGDQPGVGLYGPPGDSDEGGRAWVVWGGVFYTHPTHTRADRTAYWLHLNKRFGADVSWTGCERALETAWQRQGHLFQNPFYYIEYGIAQLGALQLWLQARRNAGTALDAYKRALSLGASRPLPELFESAGLRFDFGPETMASLIDEVRGELATIPA